MSPFLGLLQSWSQLAFLMWLDQIIHVVFSVGAARGSSTVLWVLSLKRILGCVNLAPLPEGARTQDHATVSVKKIPVAIYRWSIFTCPSNVEIKWIFLGIIDEFRHHEATLLRHLSISSINLTGLPIFHATYILITVYSNNSQFTQIMSSIKNITHYFQWGIKCLLNVIAF